MDVQTEDVSVCLSVCLSVYFMFQTTEIFP